MTSFNGLPLLIKTKIFRHLSKSEKLTCRIVCKDWTYTIDVYGSFFQYNVTMTNENFQSILNTGVPINSLKAVSNLSVLLPITSSRSEFAQTVQGLTFISSRWTEDDGLFPERQATMNMQKLLENCRYVKYLKFSRSSLIHVNNARFFGRLNLPQLGELQVEMIGTYHRKEYMAILSLITHGQFPNLVTLIFGFASCCDYSFKQYYKLYISIYEFICRHQQTLRSLSLVHPQGRMSDDPQNVYIISNDRNAKIELDLQKVSLYHLKIGIMEMKETSKTMLWSYDLNLVKQQTQLRSLEILKFGIHEDVQTAIINCQKTLVKLNTFDIQSHGVAQRFDLACLKNSTNFKSLVIGCAVKTVNLQDLPASIVSLTWCDMLSPDQLSWIITHLSGLEKLALRGFNNTIPPITTPLFVKILKSLPKLQFLHLDVRHDVFGIKDIIARICKEGQLISYLYGGKIKIEEPFRCAAAVDTAIRQFVPYKSFPPFP